MIQDTITQTLSLRDGRTLAFAAYGPAAGYPIFHCHGSPGTRLEYTLLDGVDETLARHNLRIISIDRPGIGLSSFQPKRTIAGWPQDLLAVANHLAIERFGVLGLSGGGPYALAAAAKLEERVVAVGLLSPMAPLDRPGMLKGASASSLYFYAGRIHPLLVGWIIRMAIRNISDEPPAQQAKAFPPADWALLGRPGVFRQLIETLFVEGSRQGTRGLAYEATLYWKPIGFDLRSITQPVLIWHGDDDRNAPLIHARVLDEQLPNSRLRIFAGEGHFSLFVNHLDMILGEMAAAVRA
jgi:pimeloyl-ACP methyl ester carboxylesterase